jgi:4-carboxymuconolactone decarboxylase
MSRLPRLTRDDLSPEGQAVWDRINAIRTGVRGPYGVLIHVPELADRVRALEDYFRFDGALSAADRELIILAVAREAGARFAWGVHEPRAREAGVPAEAIEALRANVEVNGLAPRGRLLVEIARALLRTRALPEDLFARGLAELGERELVEAVTLTGHYTMIGYLINGFAVPPGDGAPGF